MKSRDEEEEKEVERRFLIYEILDESLKLIQLQIPNFCSKKKKVNSCLRLTRLFEMNVLCKIELDTQRSIQERDKFNQLSEFFCSNEVITRVTCTTPDKARKSFKT